MIQPVRLPLELDSNQFLLALRGVTQATARFRSQAVTNTKAVDSAFERLGGRSITNVRADINRVRASFRAVATSGTASARDIARAWRLSRLRIRELRSEVNLTGGAFARASGGLNNAFAGLAAGVGLVEITRGIIDAGRAAQRLDRVFEQGAGSAQAAGEEYDFVREEADRLGFSLRETAESYGSFINATRGTAIAGDETREVFLGVLEASRALGLSTEVSSGALLALEQIAGKGKVSMEELRGQLGERIPGAMQIAARAMGVTSAELEKIVASGLSAEEFLPRFGAQLRKEFGESAAKAADGAEAAFGRLQTAVFELQQSFAESGLLDAVARFADFLREEVIPVLQGLGPLLRSEAAEIRAFARDLNNFFVDPKLYLSKLAQGQNDANEELKAELIEIWDDYEEQLTRTRVAGIERRAAADRKAGQETVIIAKETAEQIVELRKAAETGFDDGEDASSVSQATSQTRSQVAAYDELSAIINEIERARAANDADALIAAQERAQLVAREVGELEDQAAAKDVLTRLEQQYKLAAEEAARVLEEQATAGEKLKTELDEIPQTRELTLRDNINEVRGRLAELKTDFDELPNAIKSGLLLLNAQAATPAAVPGFATGTVLPGYGGGDRRLALLEDGEGVLRKEAVRHWSQRYGRDWFKYANLDKPLRFNVGGLVGGLPQAQQGRAPAGSSAPSGTPVHLHFPGGQSFGMSATPDVARELAATVEQWSRKHGRRASTL